MISIIIPCYNASVYLETVISAIKNQTCSLWEAIFIDDGSLDNTLLLLKEHSKTDNRIKVYAQENKGAAIARMLGVNRANGEYILFLDVDDTLTPFAVEEILEKTKNNPDIIVGSYNIYENRKHIKRKQIQFTNIDKIDYLKDTLTGKYGLELWNKVFNKKLFNSDILIPNNIRIGEDGIILIQLILKSNKIVGTKSTIYNYIINLQSISHKKSICYAIETMQAALFIENILEKQSFYNKIKDEISAMILLFYSTSTFKGYLNKKHNLIRYMANNHLRLKPLLKIPFAKATYVLLSYYTNGWITKYAEHIR